LLTITGFPAFAVGDESLCQQAKAMVVEKLEVRIGKRFFTTCGHTCMYNDRPLLYSSERRIYIARTFS